MLSHSSPQAPALPEQKGYDITYGEALKLACGKLAAISDLEAQCRRCGAEFDGRVIRLEYLNSPCRIEMPEVTISLEDGHPLDLKDRILVLHYITLSLGTPLSHRLISFREMPEGAVYFPSFAQRAIRPLADAFGREPEKLFSAARGLGGQRAEAGDASVTIPAFKFVPVQLVIWRGDDEFPPEAAILFDSTIRDYLPVEDIVVLCQTISWRLVRNSTAQAGKEG